MHHNSLPPSPSLSVSAQQHQQQEQQYETMYCVCWCSCRGTKTSCVNSDIGCRFHGTRAELQRHIDQCIYNDTGPSFLPLIAVALHSPPDAGCHADVNGCQDLLSKLTETSSHLPTTRLTDGRSHQPTHCVHSVLSRGSMLK